MLCKSHMYVHEGPGMDKREKHWSMIKHGGGSKHTNNEDGAASGDLRIKATLVMHEYMEEKYKMKLHNSTMAIYRCHTPLLLGHAHVLLE